MVYTCYSLVPRHPDLTHEQYKEHLETIHVPLLMRLWGDFAPVRYVRSYTPTAGPNALYMQPPGVASTWQYDCISRQDFRDEAHCKAATETYMKHIGEINEDAAKFMDLQRTIFMVVGESAETTKE